MKAFSNWFERFIEEKDVAPALWELVDSEGNTHIIGNDVVIDHIKIVPDHEQAKIKDILVKIDFLNGDVNHFFRHLAGAIVEAY